MSDHLYSTSLSLTVRDIFHCTIETGFLPPLMDEKTNDIGRKIKNPKDKTDYF